MARTVQDIIDELRDINVGVVSLGKRESELIRELESIREARNDLLAKKRDANAALREYIYEGKEEHVF